MLLACFRQHRLSFLHQWLRKNLFDSTVAGKSLLAEVEQRNLGILLMQFPDMADHDIASSINQAHIPGNDFCFPIKAKCLQLIERFFEAIEKWRQVNLKERQTEHFLQMQEVEKFLCTHLRTNLPAIKDLARKFLMSESNLKKHFRIVYGKNIYGYYLEKKMGLARELLLVEHQTITTVAYELGYEKVASFSKVLKNMYHLLPSELKCLSSTR